MGREWDAIWGTFPYSKGTTLRPQKPLKNPGRRNLGSNYYATHDHLKMGPFHSYQLHTYHLRSTMFFK